MLVLQITKKQTLSEGGDPPQLCAGGSGGRRGPRGPRFAGLFLGHSEDSGLLSPGVPLVLLKY